eukprot:12091326-Prorocentrum_lima.AAC.1
MEKGALFAISMQDRLLELMEEDGWLTGVHTINWWADVGTHFRSIRQLFYSEYVWPQKYRRSFSIHYGL